MSGFRLRGWPLLVILLATACFPSNEDFESQSSLLAALEKKSGLIAYVGVDANIYTIDQGGRNKQALTSDATLPGSSGEQTESRIYMFPTWSRNSEKLAFVRFQAAADGNTFSTILAAEPDGSNSSELFSSDFAQPIYLYWSPDNERLSFLTSSSGGLLLQMAELGKGDARVLDAGQPIYWSWSPDGDHLLVHIGSTGSGARLAFLTPGETIVENGVELDPALFQAPAWNGKDDHIVLLGQDESGLRELLLLDGEGRVEEQLARVSGSNSAAFARSPDGKSLAYIEGERDEVQGSLGTMTVLDVADPREPIAVIDDQVIALFWSPDSDKVAYFIPRRGSSEDSGADSETIILLELHVLDARTGLSKRLNTFLPSNEFFAILPYFDQYHNSATIWSPDSKNLVITAFVGQDQPRVLVVNSSGDLEPRPIASGQLAFWSWE
jgi:TolB protein